MDLWISGCDCVEVMGLHRSPITRERQRLETTATSHFYVGRGFYMSSKYCLRWTVQENNAKLCTKKTKTKKKTLTSSCYNRGTIFLRHTTLSTFDKHMMYKFVFLFKIDWVWRNYAALNLSLIFDSCVEFLIHSRHDRANVAHLWLRM